MEMPILKPPTVPKQPEVNDVINPQVAVSKPPKKKRKIITFMDDRKKQTTQSSNSNQKIELQKYFEDPCKDNKVCPLKYWKEKKNRFTLY